jgi:hypothetical protein
MKFLVIEHLHNGAYCISDDITGKKAIYYFCTARQAEKVHRENNGLKYKHFTRIYL